MAFENVILAQSFTASGNGLSLDSHQFLFVKIVSNKKIEPAGSGVRVLGVAQAPARNNKGVPVAFAGSISKVRAGGTIKVGQFLGPNASGQAIRHGGAGPYAALSLDDAVSGEILSALLINGS